MNIHFGTLELKSRYILAPLAGYTNLPFRRAVRELGGLGLATTDLVNARALLRANARTLELIETCAADYPMSVQIYGSEPEIMREAAQWLENYGVAAVDINMGCPVHKVTKGGGGSALMCQVDGTINLARAVVDGVRIPVSVKMRLGWDEKSWSAPFFAKAFEEVGVAAVIVHGRTREQGFGGHVNLEGIRAVAEAVDKMPVFGNGDVRTLADAQRMLEVTGCDGISIGRGALLNPWIFAQLCRWDEDGQMGETPSYHDRLRFMRRHYGLLVEQRGEHFASLTFRKVANWYCRVLKPGRDIQQRLVQLSKVADFDEITSFLEECGPPRGWHRDQMPEIAVPKGPIAHW